MKRKNNKKKASKIKILYIINDIKKSSGVSTVVMNYCRNINREKFQIDFLIMKKTAESYEEELLQNGSNVFYLKNKFSLNQFILLKQEIERFFVENKYDIVELHSPNFSFLFLNIAKRLDIPVRIVHTHSTMHSSNKIKNLIGIALNINLKQYANKYFSCSEKSGEYWFNKKIRMTTDYRVIKNAIDITKYKPDEFLRNELRKKYNVENSIVVGFVGRLSKDKNLSFLANVMKDIIKENKKYKVMIIGDGSEYKKIENQVEEIKENVLFLGHRNDVSELLNCMDLFVLTSKREGLPVVVVEAQLMNLDCFISDTITKEVDLGRTTFLKLDKNVWKEAIINFHKQECEIDRNRFDIKTCVSDLEEIYEEWYLAGNKKE